jgi:hypothetical protein
VAILVPLLPHCARLTLLGDAGSVDWLGPVQQDALLAQTVRLRAGARSDRLHNAIRTLVFLHAFAEAMGTSPEKLWPMPRGMRRF